MYFHNGTTAFVFTDVGYNSDFTGREANQSPQGINRDGRGKAFYNFVIKEDSATAVDFFDGKIGLVVFVRNM